jgi:hypothetical protein
VSRRLRAAPIVRAYDIRALGFVLGDLVHDVAQAPEAIDHRACDHPGRVAARLADPVAPRVADDRDRSRRQDEGKGRRAGRQPHDQCVAGTPAQRAQCARGGANDLAVDVPAEVVRQGFRGFVAGARILLEATHGDVGQVGVHVGLALGRVCGGRALDAGEHLVAVLPAKGRLEGQDFVEDRPQAPDVAAHRGIPLELLGRHVLGRADDDIGRERPPLAEVLGDAEIGDVPAVVFVQKDVGGLEIPVKNRSLVHVVDGSCNRFHEASRPERVLVEPVQVVGEAAPREELHREIGDALVLTDVQDRDDVRVLELADGVHLVEQQARPAAPGGGSVQHLERHGGAGVCVLGPAHDGHARHRDRFDDAVFGDLGAGRGNPGRRGVPHRGFLPVQPHGGDPSGPRQDHVDETDRTQIERGIRGNGFVTTRTDGGAGSGRHRFSPWRERRAEVSADRLYSRIRRRAALVTERPLEGRRRDDLVDPATPLSLHLSHVT